MATTPVSASSSTSIDVNTIVTQLMSIERQPIDKLNTKEASFNAKLSAFGTIKGLVASFQTALQSLNSSNSSSLLGFSATPSDTSVFSASATSTAVAGTYSLNVTSLAQSQNLVAAGKSSTTTAISNGAATTVTFDFGTISGGTLTAGVYSGATFATNGSGTKSITIDGTNNTLAGMRDAINAANMGVTATIVNDGSATPNRLTLTSNTTGVSNSLKITTTGGDGTVNALLAYDPAAAQSMTQTVAAQNANFTTNGIAITSATNTVTSAIQGVTLTLNKVTITPTSLAIARDTGAVSKAVSGFVDAFNTLSGTLKNVSAFGSSTKQAPALAGDGTVRSMQAQLRGILNTAATGGILTTLSEVGVSFQVDGTLKLDSSKLNSAMANNFSDVSNLFSSTSGFATRLDAWATSIVSGAGVISSRTTSINQSIVGIHGQLSTLEVRMTNLQKQYTKTYSNLNVMLSNMNATSNYLSQQLSRL